MRPTKLTQTRAVFYLLWKTYQKNPGEFMPTWRALGELEVPELGEAFFMSYKTPTNGFNIFFQNPELVERKWMEGKSGAKYFTYRLKSPFLPSNIVEKSLRDFYDALVGKNMVEVEQRFSTDGELKEVKANGMRVFPPGNQNQATLF